MPYGNGSGDGQNRIIELGSTAVEAGSALANLRLQVIDARRAFVAAGWPSDPTLLFDRKSLDHKLLAKQAEFKECGLNSKWAEKGRIQATASIVEQCRRALRTFAGRLAYIDAVDEKKRPTSIPKSLFDRLPEATEIELKGKLKEKGGLSALLTEARRLVGLLGDGFKALGDEEREASCIDMEPKQAVLAWLFGHVLHRYGPPAMDAGDRDGEVLGTVQLHLDDSCLRPARVAYQAALGALTDAAPSVIVGEKQERIDLMLTAVRAHGEGIPFSVALSKKPLCQLLLAGSSKSVTGEAEALVASASSVQFRSLTLEIGPETARVTAVVTRPEPVNSDMVRDAHKAEARTRSAVARKEKEGDEKEIEKARKAHADAVETLQRRTQALEAALGNIRVIAGVDPGTCDAISVVALRVPEGETIKLERVMALGEGGKKEMREFFSTHALENPERAAAAWAYVNKPFTDYAKRRLIEIAALSVKIDACYRRIAILKARVNASRGVPLSARIPEKLPSGANEELRKAHRAFFLEYAKVRKLKGERRELWRRLHAVKRCWHGMLANRLANYALTLKAGVALEDGDWGIEERGSDDYRGPGWNKLQSFVSQRGLLKVVKDKLNWLGVVWWTVSSPYTSTTDPRYGIVDSGQRRNGGKVFVAQKDGMRMDADEHAAETIGVAAILRPIAATRQGDVSPQDEEPTPEPNP